jgi:hypothetical protein
MLNFRQFEAGPDPFGHKYQVMLKWLQTAISIRHSDTVDVKFVLTDENGVSAEKAIAMQHADLLTVSRETGRVMDDPWCSRLAALHLVHLIETGEDLEKDLVTMTLADLRRHAEQEKKSDFAAVHAK